jgi:hypothetical protein
VIRVVIPRNGNRNRRPLRYTHYTIADCIGNIERCTDFASCILHTSYNESLPRGPEFGYLLLTGWCFALSLPNLVACDVLYSEIKLAEVNYGTLATNPLPDIILMVQLEVKY